MRLRMGFTEIFETRDSLIYMCIKYSLSHIAELEKGHIIVRASLRIHNQKLQEFFTVNIQ